MEQILWSSATRFHDWWACKFPFDLLKQAKFARVIGSVEWIKQGWGRTSKLKQIHDEESIDSYLLKILPKSEKTFILEAGGTKPHSWKLSLYIPPFSQQKQRVDGYSMIKIIFEGASLQAPEHSSTLLETFFATHTPDNTEFAFIHPYLHWSQLEDGNYNSPVTFRPMFAGVYWANYLGLGHIELFDRQKLNSLSAYHVKWIDDRGLFLVITPNLADVLTPAIEEKMLKLTEEFRRARQ
jgi:hypothetical protein